MQQKVALFWFRRDLRFEDNVGLWHALQSGLPVVPLFIFDTTILSHFDNPSDRRVQFIYTALSALQSRLISLGSCMDIRYGAPQDIWPQLVRDYAIEAVYTNHDYEPESINRDAQVESLLNSSGIPFYHFKDIVVFEKYEVVKEDGNPYTVFTPYSKRWKARLLDFPVQQFSSETLLGNFFRRSPIEIPSLESMGYKNDAIQFPSSAWEHDLIQHYQERRDIPSIRGTSRLGVHLRFGTISIRTLVKTAGSISETYLNELIWRDFYHMILFHFPHVGRGKSFKPAYELIPWRNDEADFRSWTEGRTGYPIVDAGMRELNATGFMHNRVRMIVASFLTKHLLIDWRWGEAYFAQHLLDFDLAANNGGWQWAAGSGCDAAPYFRVFNPTLQTQKFDPELRYIRTWVPELDQLDYPSPVVQHELARKRCLDAYASVLKK